MNYKEARDNRTDGEYKKMVEDGIKKQVEILDKIKKQLGITYILYNENEKFSTDGPGSYYPDAFVWFNDNLFTYPTEIKYSHKTPYIDFKKWQIDKLCNMDGIIIYSTALEYSITKAYFIKRVGYLVSRGFLNKEAYRINWNDLMWNKYAN